MGNVASIPTASWTLTVSLSLPASLRFDLVIRTKSAYLKSQSVKLSTALYGVVLFLAALAYWILEMTIIHHEGHTSRLAKAVGRNLKEKISLMLYLVAILFSFFYSCLAECIYVFVAIMWLIPDRRIERILNEK